MAEHAERPDVVEGEVVYPTWPSSQSRQIVYDQSHTIRRVDPNRIQVRRTGPFGLGQHQGDLAHRETIIADNQLTEETINMEGNAVRAEVSGIALTTQGAGAMLEMVERTHPNTTFGRFMEDIVGGGLGRLRDNHPRFQEALTAEQLTLLHNRQR